MEISSYFKAIDQNRYKKHLKFVKMAFFGFEKSNFSSSQKSGSTHKEYSIAFPCKTPQSI
jgi:hypothetical protein